ncbi:uncharacterized protein DS421_1g14910 [Arachis hypogaea]|nr:uncharacterized protein DS421_1g14910 [Arachis hypogaea]
MNSRMGYREEGVYGGAFHLAREFIQGFDENFDEEGGEESLPLHEQQEEGDICGCGFNIVRAYDVANANYTLDD